MYQKFQFQSFYLKSPQQKYVKMYIYAVVVSKKYDVIAVDKYEI